ncbi:MAG: glucose-1-phosphate adenylyltransferase [Acidobacteriota bacterium]|nr:MAG: glucose-1-phosphate adenylyltransferase [Acidobacteriota bacterium]
MNSVVTAILGGGRGERLWPLTRSRAKPAVPVAGKFRLIDIPISNSLRAGIDRIFVLTQFNSASLHRHIAQTYRFDTFSKGFVNILAAEQSLESRDWYQGTADAVRKTLRRLLDGQPEEILILSGDQLYKMDLERCIETHRERDADITIAVKPVSSAEAKSLGILRMDGSGRLVEFVEKPQDEDVIDGLALDQHTIDVLGLEASPGSLLASMGIYVFRPRVLEQLLVGTTTTDFGKEVIPSSLKRHAVYGFLHHGYWRDIGTIKGFHDANLELTHPLPAFDLYDPDFPIYTHPRFLPGCKISSCSITNSIVCGGSILSGSRVTNSIVGIRMVVREGCVLEEAVLLGATGLERGAAEPARTPMGLGRNCLVRRAIIDLDARIGDDVRLVNESGRQHADADNYCIRDGIVVVPRGAEIPSGTIV